MLNRPRQQANNSAQNRADEVILEAERRRASLLAPMGMLPNEFTVPPVDYNFSDDGANNFLHVSCHMETTASQKIMKGGFLEIEKLVPRNKSIKSSEEGSLQMINREGKTYLVPSSSQENVKVTNFGKWEQGFRVYVAIYSKANPMRAAEIYQYIHTIHLASQSFIWDNVMYYDYYFRKNMEQNPQRSWAKTHTQLWTLSMRELIIRYNNSNNGNTNKVRQGEWKDICCWRYNRNQCKKAAKDCKYEHKCSYCGSPNHIYLGCQQRKRQQQNNHSNTDMSSSNEKKENKN